ncbi:hypothetical protein JOE38_002651 [Clavibacter michiganensis]|uniref:hypothetical protein n=1 Tax=Clavibacter michiganensis TaxID=28447 RepID=UPI00195621D3|nr:hypothetical protein [Clavibacter michiganensis]MBM7412828.1 hypothetical protein [Clavibacter michiganensis]
MRETEAIARAQAMWDAGRRREATASLVDRVRSHPRDGVARLTLAGWYRELGAPDQAGRWGIATPGWTTASERDRLARMIASSGHRDAGIASFLALPDPRLPDHVAELLPLVAAHRERYARIGTPVGELAPATDPRRQAAVGLCIAAAVVFALGMLLAGILSLFGVSTVGVARWAGVVALVLVKFAVIFEGTRPRPGRRWITAIALAVAVSLVFAYWGLARIA